jgi:hypothetical protein
MALNLVVFTCNFHQHCGQCMLGRKMETFFYDWAKIIIHTSISWSERCSVLKIQNTINSLLNLNNILQSLTLPTLFLPTVFVVSIVEYVMPYHTRMVLPFRRTSLAYLNVIYILYGHKCLFVKIGKERHTFYGQFSKHSLQTQLFHKVPYYTKNRFKYSNSGWIC